MADTDPPHKVDDGEAPGAGNSNAPDSDAEGSFFRRIFAKQHSLSDGKYDATGKSEENANGDKRPDGVGCRAEVREDGISDERGPVDAVIAEARRESELAGISSADLQGQGLLVRFES